MIVASRNLKYHSGTATVDIPVKIFAPTRASNGNWACDYEVGWPDKTWKMTVWGADSLQALMLAFYMIGSEIYTSNYHKSGKLVLDAPGDGYGFPVPVSLRDLLEGSDAKFF